MKKPVGLDRLGTRIVRELLSSFDQPLKIAHDQMVGKDRLLCAYNRVEYSYRSTWSNQYEPFLDGGAMPIERVRKVRSTSTEKCILRAVCLRLTFGTLTMDLLELFS